MTPPPMCLAPTQTATLTRVNSCEPIPPTCSDPEPMVVHDEARAMSYVSIGRRCIEELHRIPGLNLFRSAPQLRTAPRNSTQHAPQQGPDAPVPHPVASPAAAPAPVNPPRNVPPATPPGQPATRG